MQGASDSPRFGIVVNVKVQVVKIGQFLVFCSLSQTLVEKAMSSSLNKFGFFAQMPEDNNPGRHTSLLKMHSLMRRQLSDLDVIETINHLFRCSRCYENFRRVRKAYLAGNKVREQ